MSKRNKKIITDEEKDLRNSRKVPTKRGPERSRHNDPSWYTRNEQLALDAGRFSFTWPTGAPINLGPNRSGVTSNILGNSGDTIKLPGVITMEFVPAYGPVSVPEDPLNLAMFDIYGHVRFKNSGSTNYDPPDLMLYLMAMDNIYMVYQYLVRTYGLLRLYAQRNRNYPRLIFNALGLDYDDLLSHMADLRMYINVCALKISSMCVPNVMPIYKRHMWMCGGVYQDAPTIKSQLYIFKPIWVGKYNEKSANTGGFLEGDSTLNGTGITFNTLVALMDDMLGRVVQSEDCNIMSGDILKAYGSENLFQIMMISDDYMVVPEYRTEVLRQIQNATLVKTVALANYASKPCMLYQDPNDGAYLQSALTISDGCYHIMGKRILVGSDEAPGPEEVLESTRLMVTAADYTLSGTSVSTTNVLFDNPHYGTEVITNARLFDLDIIGGGRIYYGRNVTAINDGQEAIDRRVGFFNYHPLIGQEKQTYTSSVLTGADWYFDFDVDDYAILDDHDVEKVHSTALLSLFNVPQGKVSETK